MKKIYWIGTVAMVALALGVGQGFAQDEDEEEDDGGMEEVEEVEEVEEEEVDEEEPAAADMAWRAATKEHAALAKTTGDYSVAVEMFMAPGQPAEKSTGTAKRESIMNGMYLQETFSMPMQGAAFSGRATVGYDTVRKQYVQTWIDNTSPVMSVSYGTEKGGMIVYTFEDPDPMTGKLAKGKSTVKMNADGTSVMTMYKVTDDGDQMTMRLTYTRKK